MKDDDQDGLNNGLEGLLGSNSQLSDSDNDGVADADELTPGQDLVDTDGDGKPDIVESASLDGDGDCITDQFDARDGTVDSDPSPMLSQVCRSAGVCATQEGRLRVSCESGSAQCVYADVEGFADPESACDQRDENCDGQVDEAFPGGCPKDTVRSWLAPATSATTTASSRYRATLTYGPPLGGAAASARHRVVLGRVPASE